MNSMSLFTLSTSKTPVTLQLLRCVNPVEIFIQQKRSDILNDSFSRQIYICSLHVAWFLKMNTKG